MDFFRNILIQRLTESPSRVAFTVKGDSGEEHSYSYAHLISAAVAIGRDVVAVAGRGGRALIVSPVGLEFVAAFIGCWIHGVIAIPAYSPKRNWRGGRIEKIIQDAAPAVIIGDESLRTTLVISEGAPASASIALSEKYSAGDDAMEPDSLVDYINEHMGGRTGEEVVFLQYTSGSTGDPRGVMVAERNLGANIAEMRRKFGVSPESIMVSWLPPYHDMGLVLGILLPLYSGFPCHLFDASLFMQRPLLWLRMISDKRATISGGPNFAYALCTRRAERGVREEFDLSSWCTAFNGAEPVRAQTLLSFARTFENYGFRSSAWHPCYGLAENTLMVSGWDRGGSQQADATYARYFHVDESGRTMIGCGTTIAAQSVLIVDPQKSRECPPGAIGEIWVTGDSVCMGYWKKDAVSDQIFRASLAEDEGGKEYLRTGDLGLILDGVIYVSGRLKDIIAIRGVKHCPQDFEQSIEAKIGEIRTGGYCAVFQMDRANAYEDGVIVALELARESRRVDIQNIRHKVTTCLQEEFGVSVIDVLVLPPNTFPKTSSGKVPRTVIRKMYETGEFTNACVASLAK